MTRKGAKQRGWTSGELAFLRDCAGKMPRREICRTLKRSKNSVEMKSRCLGVSLRCFRSQLEWCPVCATLRSHLSPSTGQCRVCSKRKQYDKGECRVSEALEQLTPKERLIYEEEEAKRGSRKLPRKPLKPLRQGSLYERQKTEEAYLLAIERWEIRCLDLKIDANKTRLKRIREKTGSNPRKKRKSNDLL